MRGRESGGEVIIGGKSEAKRGGHGHKISYGELDTINGI